MYPLRQIETYKLMFYEGRLSGRWTCRSRLGPKHGYPTDVRLIYWRSAVHKLSICSACDFDQHPFAIGCGHDTFETIRKAFQLHESSEEAILNNNGAFGRYFLRSPNASDIDSFGKTYLFPTYCTLYIFIF